MRLISDNMPGQLKMPFVLWTRAAVRDLIEDRYQITLALTTRGNYLKRWGFTAQKPTRKAFAQNGANVERWIKEEYPEIEQRAKAEKTSIFWGDEGKVRNEVHAGKSFSKKGHTLVVKESGRKFKLNHISAIKAK